MIYSCPKKQICYSSGWLRGSLEGVLCLVVIGTSFPSYHEKFRLTFRFVPFPKIQQTVKRTDETHEFCKSYYDVSTHLSRLMCNSIPDRWFIFYWCVFPFSPLLMYPANINGSAFSLVFYICNHYLFPPAAPCVTLHIALFTLASICSFHGLMLISYEQEKFSRFFPVSSLFDLYFWWLVLRYFSSTVQVWRDWP